jgi:hypothetical protein
MKLHNVVSTSVLAGACDMKNTSTDSSTESPAPKPPIYPVSVIEMACRVLEVIAGSKGGALTLNEGGNALLAQAAISAIRIIHAGLASQERAIKGEP